MEYQRSIKHVTRPAVLKALAEYDQIGQAAFLQKYGYKPSTGYPLQHDGNSYDSKAIVGAAFGYLPGNPPPLRWDEHSGGKAYIVPLLEKLGFPFGGKRNPPWTRDELILALDLYVRHKGTPLSPGHPEVVELSELLNAIAEVTESATFRNPNGVAMKLMNFRALDPAFTSKGGVGLSSTGKGDKAIWAEFAGKPQELAVAATAIRAGALTDKSDEALEDEQDDYSAEEGRIRYRIHRHRERDGKVVELRKNAALKAHGKLECEVCEFDFAEAYGERGYGFIEAHHTNPVHAMQEGDVTKPEDLALLCANCHRMVHAAKPWLTLEQLRAIVVG